MFAEPNEFHYGILRPPVNWGTADMFAKWPILAEKASLSRVNAAWLSRSERRAYAYSTLRPPTFSGDSLASAVWLTVRPNGMMKLQDVILKAMAKSRSRYSRGESYQGYGICSDVRRAVNRRVIGSNPTRGAKRIPLRNSPPSGSIKKDVKEKSS